MNYFNPAESVILVEIYLPKKAHLQGILYACLTKGLIIEEVKDFLRENELEVRKLMNEVVNTSYLEDFDSKVANLREVFTGYSLYEVDGVWKGVPPRSVDEERTQVIRIIFRPGTVLESVGLKPELEKNVIRDYLTLRVYEKNDSFYEGYATSDPGRTDEDRERIKLLLKELVRWEAETAIFLFGFVILSITLELKKLDPTMAQDEIWVTSIWGMKVNRVTAGKH